MDVPLWVPSEDRILNAHITRYMRQLNEQDKGSFSTYDALHAWSVKNVGSFWKSIWDYCQVQGDLGNGAFLEQQEDFLQARFFPHARLNYAENLLQGLSTFSDDEPVIVFWAENGLKQSITKAELLEDVRKYLAWFQSKGLRAGDPIGAIVANTPQTVAAVIASSALGLVWASCSPDFGVEGILDRLEQVQPKALLATEGYYYKGKYHSCVEKVSKISEALGPEIPLLVSSFPGERKSSDFDAVLGPKRDHFDTLIADPTLSLETFERFDFNHPLFIMFSSGTTGRPKCIVHGAGGTLLQHMKEHQLHCDIKPKDRVFYYSTCSWMMWNWHLSALASGAVLLLFEGSPLHPNPAVLFDFAQEEKMTLFGTASKYIDFLRKEGTSPKETHDLKALKTLTSTGGPLVHESFEYIYQHVKEDLCVASIAGGTDIISCFVLGCPLLPVYTGQIQCMGLGMDMDVFDEKGHPLRGTQGELVCKTPFPSKPLGFLNDVDHKRYKQSYFHRFENIWCHGDFAEITPQNGLIIHGRSDAVLNPGGVRIGTAEIYRQAEKVEEVVESLAVGQEWEDDIRVILFVHLAEGVTLTEELSHKIKTTIRNNATPRHVPAKIIQVPVLPKTKNGKLVELVVRDLIHNRPITNKNTLANPDCLEYFMNLPELQVA